jgi:hypothetical protein
MITSFQFRLPESFDQFVNNWLGFISLLFAVGFLVAVVLVVKEGMVSVNRLRRTLALMFKRSAGGD